MKGQKKQSVFVVIPTIRDLSFLESWGDEFKDCEIIVVEDRKRKKIRIPQVPIREVHHFCWEDIENDFPQSQWIFARKNAGIRSYGFWKAYKMGADIIITLDDDCYPAQDPLVEMHVENLSLKAPEGWFTTHPNPSFMYTRGFPYGVRGQKPVVLSHGLWSGVLDLDAKTLIKHPNLDQEKYPPLTQFVPENTFFPMSSMNLAFTREVASLMYFPLMGEDQNGKTWGYDRFDDIWAGIMAKKVIDHLGWSVVNGSPFVHHKGASDVKEKIKKEENGIKANEWFFKRVEAVKLSGRKPATCYRQLAEKLELPKQRYFNRLKEAMIVWTDLFL